MAPPIPAAVVTPAAMAPGSMPAGLSASVAIGAATSDPTSIAKLPRIEAKSASGEADAEAVEADDDDEDVESTKHLSLLQQLEMMRGKLARRNKILEVVRRAYYHDVIVVKEELRHIRPQHPHSTASTYGSLNTPPLTSVSGGHQASPLPPSSSRSTVSNAPSVLPTTRGIASHHHAITSDDRLSSIPSIDLRDVLPLFAPSETVLKLHPCEACGGHLELVHGESRELQAARQEMARATKSEQQMKTIVHRLRTEAKEKDDLHDALQQRVKALVKENSYTLEQLQASRKMERDQKTAISNLRSKLQVAQTTQEDLDHLTAEYKDAKQQLIRSNHDRDIFSASNNHLKEELAEISKTLHQAKVDRAQLESDFGTTYYKLQEELKKTKQLRDELASERTMLKDRTKLSEELQQSLAALKDEFAVSTMRAEQAKRQLEDQLADEEKAREDAQEQTLEFRKINKKLLRDLEHIQRDTLGFSSADSSSYAPPTGPHHDGGTKLSEHLEARGGGGTMDMKMMIRKKIEAAQHQLEHALMREHDLLGQAVRQQEAAAAAAAIALAKPPPIRKKVSRMPSTTVITRFVPPELLHQVGAVAADSLAADAGATRPGSSGNERPTSGSSRWQGGASPQIAEGDALEGDGIGELDEKGFENYHQDLHRLMVEIDDGNERSQKQQKVITELERKNQTLLDRLEEAKLSIETLSGSVAALKARLNQDSAGAAEHLEDMMREVEESKRDQQYENERGLILLDFLRTVSNFAYELSSSPALVVEFDLERPSVDTATDDADSLLSPELLLRKRELRKKVLMDRAMKKFSQQCHQRAENVAIELKKMADHVTRLRVDLDEAENKIDSDQLVIRNFEAENSKLQLTVEVTKTNLGRSDKELKQTRDELQEALARCTVQLEDLKVTTAENEEMKADITRLSALLFEKTKAWEKEMHANDKTSQVVARLEQSQEILTVERDALAAKLQEIEDLAEWKLSTNREVGIMVMPEVVEAEMQTDRWRPQGLILRQRNDPQRIPQRYLGKACVTIACGPELLEVDKPPKAPLAPLSSTRGSVNQSPRLSLAEPWADPTEHAREALELDIFPPARAGGRQTKTSQATSRTRNLSRLFLSSDGVSQKYIAPSREPSARPSTSL